MTRLSAEASRAAIRTYLREQVGEGGTFTLLGLREVFPSVTQIDRRMRELRQTFPVPWLIASSQSDLTLTSGVYRVDRIGSDRIVNGPSARVRREVFEAAGNRCQVCGVGVGEEYLDFPGEFARLQLGHWVPREQGGSPTGRGNLRAECHRCNGGIRDRTGAASTTESVTARIRSLSRRQMLDLLRWLEQGQRDVPDEERLFYEARQLPPSAQAAVVDLLRQRVNGS